MRRIKHAKKGIISTTWNFLWHSDSWVSWVVDLILLYILIKFIILPFIGFIFAVKITPFVIVESSSMEHKMPFDDWWQKHSYLYEARGISKEEFLKFDFKNGFNTGDILVAWGRFNRSDLEVGDVIVFDAGQTKPVTHRIVHIDTNSNFETLGDNNFGQLSFEKGITKERVIAKVPGKVPALGWGKLAFTKLFNKLK